MCPILSTQEEPARLLLQLLLGKKNLFKFFYYYIYYLCVCVYKREGVHAYVCMHERGVVRCICSVFVVCVSDVIC